MSLGSSSSSGSMVVVQTRNGYRRAHRLEFMSSGHFTHGKLSELPLLIPSSFISIEKLSAIIVLNVKYYFEASATNDGEVTFLR